MNNTALITGLYGGLETCFVEIHAKTGGKLILVGGKQDNECVSFSFRLTTSL